MRDSSIDQAKGILIFLVVLGHVAGMMSHFASGAGQVALAFVYKWIYLFHMPAFFFLAGVVNGKVKRLGAIERSEIAEGLREQRMSFLFFLGKKVRRLLVPYFFWGVVSVVVFLAMGKFMGLLSQGATTGRYARMGAAADWWQPFVSLLHAGGWPHGEGFRCNSVLWFLPVMFVVSIAFELFSRATKNLTSILHLHLRLHLHLISISLLFALGGALRIYHFGGLPWGLSLAPYYLAFMILGDLFAQRSKKRSSPFFTLTSSLHLSFAWLAFTVVAWMLPDMGVAWWQWKWFVVQGLMAVWGSVLLLITVKKWNHHCPPTFPTSTSSHSTWLSKLGLASLGIMVTHKFLVLAVQMGLGRLGPAAGGDAHCASACLWQLGFASADMRYGGTVAWLGAALVVSIGITYLTYRLTLLLRRVIPFALGEQKRI